MREPAERVLLSRPGEADRALRIAGRGQRVDVAGRRCAGGAERLRQMLRDLGRIAPPQPDVMALQGKIARGCN